MTVKRSRDEGDDDQVEAISLANCLMLLSRVGKSSSDDDISEATTTTTTASSDSDHQAAPSGRVFECKTCNKRFHSFQALGGHRASHKKLRLVAELCTRPSSPPAKAKKHECSICGLEFPLGQALGGHMRRHRAELEEKREINGHINSDNNTTDDHQMVPMQSVLKTSNSKRVFGLDLNLTPSENDLKHLGMIESTAATPLLVI